MIMVWAAARVGGFRRNDEAGAARADFLAAFRGSAA
jgi:hypothetical protein